MPSIKTCLRFIQIRSFQWFALLILILISFSCVSQRNVEYLQDRNKEPVSYYDAEVSDYRLKPNDELYIQINSLDDPASNIFSTGNSYTQMGVSTPFGASLLSYDIDKEGYIHLPFIGKIYVENSTTDEVTAQIKDSLIYVLNQPSVTVKLVNRYVSVLGEVRTPGHFAFAQDKLTIFNAIGLAGDITDYGNRKEVMVTRNENDINTQVIIDLTDPSILASDYYYIRPNDLVYVKPLRKKKWGMREFPFALIFSAITTSLLVISYIQQ